MALCVFNKSADNGKLSMRFFTTNQIGKQALALNFEGNFMFSDGLSQLQVFDNGQEPMRNEDTLVLKLESITNTKSQ